MTDIGATRGDTLIFDVYATRKDINGVDQPIPLAGSKVWFTVKRSTRDVDTDALIAKNSEDDPTEVALMNPPEGIVRITIPAGDMDELPQSYLPFDVQLREADGTITTIQRGSLEVERDSTISVT